MIPVAGARVPATTASYKARIAVAGKLGIRLWIMMRDQIDYEELCRRGKLRQSGETHAGMLDFNSGPALQ